MLKTICSKFKIDKLSVLLLLIILSGLVVRFYKLGQIPLGLYWDETAMLADAKIVAQTGHDLHQRHWLQPLFLSYGDYKLPVYIWLAAFSVKLLGATNFALRLVSALAGVGTVITSILIAQKLFPQIKNKKILSIGVAFVVSLSPWPIMFSRTGFEGHLGQFLFSGAVLLLLKTKDKWWWLIPATFLASLATYTYFSVRFVWPVVLIAGLSLLLLTQNDKPNLFNKGPRSLFNSVASISLLSVLSLAIFGLTMLPMVNSPFYEASNTFRFGTNSVFNMRDWPIIQNQLRAQAGNTIWSRIYYHRHWLMIKEFLINLSEHVSLNYIFLRGDQNLRHGTGRHGLFLLPSLGFFVLGLYQLARKYLPQLLFLVSWWLTALVPASVPEGTPHALRSLNGLVPLSLLIAFGLYWVLKWMFKSQQYLPRLKKLFGWTFLSTSLVALVAFTYHYFLVYPEISAKDWQAGFQAVAEKTCQLADQADQVWVQMSDGRFFLWPLAYCDYNPDELENFKFEKYQLIEMSKIMFRDYDLNNFNQTDKKVLLVTDRDQLVDQIEFESYEQLPINGQGQVHFYWNI